MPSSKRNFGRSGISPDVINRFFDAWLTYAWEFGQPEISGWQGTDASNTIVENFSSFDDFIQAYSDDPPRAFVSARTARKAFELRVDYSRSAGTQIFIRMPSTQMVEEVFETLGLGPESERGTIRETDLSDEYPSNRSIFSSAKVQPLNIDDPVRLAPRKGNDVIIAKLRWSNIDDEEFERLIFTIVANADGYANPKWLMRTNAPDRSRDISVDRLTKDALSGFRTQRVIIQAKHWLVKSLRPDHISAAVTQMSLWEPPLVNVLIMATSGRFTADAVAWVERHNETGSRPLVEMWPESHLELILANMPGLVDEFQLK